MCRFGGSTDMRVLLCPQPCMKEKSNNQSFDRSDRSHPPRFASAQAPDIRRADSPTWWRRPGVAIQRITQVETELLIVGEDYQIEIALTILGVRDVLIQRQVCKTVEVVEPPVVHIEPVDTGLLCIDSQQAVRIVCAVTAARDAPAKRTHQQLVKEKALALLSLHQQAGVEDPKAGRIVQVSIFGVSVDAIPRRQLELEGSGRVVYLLAAASEVRGAAGCEPCVTASM